MLQEQDGQGLTSFNRTSLLKILTPDSQHWTPFKKIHGIGIIATATKPSRDTAQLKPSRSIIFKVNGGKGDDTIKRRKVLAASTSREY